MKTAVYCRVSTDEQRERQTIENQVELSTAYCESHELAIAELYRDDGVSGTLPLADRPEGKRLLEDAKSKKFDRLLVKQVDRLGRDALYILNAVYQLEALGIQVISILEPIDLSTPQGKFMLTIDSGVAALERDTIIQRSVEGTDRLARQGVWLGGIVPYGYQVVGKDRDARLVVSDEPVPGVGMTKADVVKLMYQMAAHERQTCFAISDRLNALGVPPAYVRDGRQVRRGTRTVATAGIWRASRVRNLITNTTYKGIHQYGRRSKRRREVIERDMPSIVSVEIWEQAQKVLHDNMILSPRNAKRRHLLRGVIRCGTCGLTYVCSSHDYKGKTKTYYRCNGKASGRGLYGQQGRKCPSKNISGAVEEIVWQDIEGFLRNPGSVLEQLGQRLDHEASEAVQLHDEVTTLRKALQAKQQEGDRVVALYRRGRIEEETLDRQLDEIQREEARLKDQIDGLVARTEATEATQAQLRSADDLLRDLNACLDAPLTWDVKRRLVETLVEGIRVDTVDHDGAQAAVVTMTYCFSRTANHKDTRADSR